ncbi:MAG: HEAT repeat domain-containing protein, partial [Quisquiliibacterium sp.]
MALSAILAARKDNYFMRGLLLVLLLMFSMTARAAVDQALLARLASDDSDEKIAAIHAIAGTADPDAAGILQSLAEGTFTAPDGSEIMINNRIRGELANAIAGLRLFSPDLQARLTAARELQTNIGEQMVPSIRRALAKETDPQVRLLLGAALAQANLASQDPKVRLAAVKALAEVIDPNTRGLLLPLTRPEGEPDVAVRSAAIRSLSAVQTRLSIGENLGQLFTGLSLGSILLLAALGLAITDGVMGVINMAHGELLMIGAYSTYAVQSLFRSHLPGWVDFYVLAAIPVAFVISALVGVILARTGIRYLYGRPQ